MTTDDEYEVRNIPLEDLFVSESNVRRRDIVADVDELARSIEKHGLLQPIVAKPRGGKFEILVGQRRYLAYKQLRRSTIPARIVSPDSRLSEAILSFSENIQRRDLAPRDKAEACVYLLRELGSVARVAEELGVSEPTVRKWVGYDAVPDELKDMVEEHKLTRGQASRIWESVPDVEQAVNIGRWISEAAPPKDTAERVLSAAEELPGQTLEVWERRAQETQQQVLITFVLPEKWMKAISRAAEELGKDTSDIARDATIEWLQAHELFADL